MFYDGVRTFPERTAEPAGGDQKGVVKILVLSTLSHSSIAL